MRTVQLEIARCSTADVRRLAAALGVSPIVAEILVRRDLGEPSAARAFLAAEDAHPPSAFAGIELAVETIIGHVRSGAPITVHGDYDCDGVCSTAVLVRCLRVLGANVDWFLPDRRSDGYGLSIETIERLAAQGTKLLITADCAITAVAEVAAARAAGVDVVVTDHHTPRADGQLPDAPIVHPGLCGYPCTELCATAVAAKLAGALRAAAGLGETEPDADLELVALATVADVVSLRGENRRLVRAGLRALAVDRESRPAGADGRRPGLATAGRRARARVPPGAPDQRGRPALSRRHRARAAAHRRRRPRRGDRRRARPRQRRAADHGDPDPLRGRGAGRSAGDASGICPRRRGLASRRDRDRRRPDRRAPPPPDRDDRPRPRRRTRDRLGPLDPGLRPARRPPRLR